MKTRNTLNEYFLAQDNNITYEGLEKAAENVMIYMTTALKNNQPFSEIVKNMPEKLGYTLHVESFATALNVIVSKMPNNEMKEGLCLSLQELDDIGLLAKTTYDIQLTPESLYNYTAFELKHNDSKFIPEYLRKEDTILTPTPTNIPPVPPKQEDTYINLPAKDPEPDHPSWYTNEFSFDDHNKKILLFTAFAFITIRVLAYYYKDNSDKISENSSPEHLVENETLNSAYESLFLSSTSFYKVLIGFIPISLLIIYKLRYYYFYKFKIKYL